ncbi:MAG: methyltransferase, partial [Myxococcota bacterium]|nr:methyltransferase [Myxococcota bacterium]
MAQAVAPHRAHAAPDATAPRAARPDARWLPPHLFALLGGLGLVAHAIRPTPILLRAPVAAVLAGALGTFLVLASVRLFARAGTSLRPDRPSRRLVTEGPYRVSRNPMYLGLVLLLAGLGLALGTPTALAAPGILAVLLDRAFVRPEERALEATLGAPEIGR